MSPLEGVEDANGAMPIVRAVGMLGVEGQGDPEGSGYFSTPVTTIPRVK